MFDLCSERNEEKKSKGSFSSQRRLPVLRLSSMLHMIVTPTPNICHFSGTGTISRSILARNRNPILPDQSQLSPPAVSTSSPELGTALAYLPPLLSLLPIDLQLDSTSFSSLSAVSTRDPDPPLSVGFTSSRLPSIDIASLHLHYALHQFRPTGVDYYQVAYRDAFNWSELRLPLDVEREWSVNLPHP